MQKTLAKTLLAGLAPAGFDGGELIDRVTTDSREARPGSIFVAFPGARLQRPQTF